MADASKKVNIGITTTANTAGADQMVSAIKKIETADAAYYAKKSSLLTAEEAETQRVFALVEAARSREAAAIQAAEQAIREKIAATKSLEEANKKAYAQSLKLEQVLSGTKARVGTIAFYDLDKAILKSHYSSTQLERSVSKAGNAIDKAGKDATRSSSRMAYSLGNVGNQVQDIAVQAESGTSALRIFTQQAPQIAGAFGPYGAIGGALLALGAIAFKTFSDMGADVKTAEERANELATAIDGVIEIAKDLSNAEIDFALGAIKASTDQANLLATAFDESEKSAADFTTKSLGNFEKVRLALVELAKLNGKQVDSVDEVKAKDQAASIARLNQANLDIQAQNDRAEAASQTVSLASQELESATRLSFRKQEDIALEEEKLNKLRLQKAELEGQKRLLDTLEANALEKGGLVEFGVQKFLNREPRAQIQQSQEGVQGNIQITESRIADLEKAIQQGGTITNAVIAAAQKLTEATIRESDVLQSAAIAIESIQQSFNAEELKAKIDTAKEQSKAVATDIKSFIDELKPTNDAQKQAVEGLGVGVKDLQLTSNETLTTAAQLNALARALPSAETAKQATITALLNKVQELQSDLNATNTQVNKLTAQKTVPLRTN